MKGKRIAESQVVYAFILLCGFSFILMVIIYPEIKTKVSLHAINMEIWGLRTRFSQENKVPTTAGELMQKRAEFTRHSCRKPEDGSLQLRYLTKTGNKRIFLDEKSIPRLLPQMIASRLLVDDKRKLMFCYIPKVACSNWKRVFLSLLGIVPIEEVAEVQGVHFYIQRYLVFKVERLLSAFRNKVLHPEQGDKFRYADEMRRFYEKYRSFPFNRTTTWTLITAGISFEMFLRYLLDQGKVGKRFDPHYELYENLCDPCKIRYDYIGDFGNLEAEANAIFKELSIDFKFPTRTGNSSAEKTVDVISEYIRTVPKELLRDVVTLYGIDFKRYGYDPSRWAS